MDTPSADGNGGTPGPWSHGNPLPPCPQYKMVVCNLTAEVCLSPGSSVQMCVSSPCAGDDRENGEGLIGTDPQTAHTPPPTLSPSSSQTSAASLQGEGGTTRTSTPASSLSKGNSAPHIQDQGWGIAMNPLTSVGDCWLSIGSKDTSGVPKGLFHKTCHSGDLGSIPCRGIWVRGTGGVF